MHQKNTSKPSYHNGSAKYQPKHTMTIKLTSVLLNVFIFFLILSATSLSQSVTENDSLNYNGTRKIRIYIDCED
jgi:hypothetical protein